MIRHDHHAHERDLRAAAGVEPGAISILADFYEQCGQPTRAKLWRDQLLEREQFSTPPDLVVRPSTRSPVDPRRNVMIWLLLGLYQSRGSTDPMGSLHDSNQLVCHFELTWPTLRNVVKQRDRKIRKAALDECQHPTMRATQRLVAAGALPSPVVRGEYRATWQDPQHTPPDRFLISVEVPPDTWPFTDNDARRRNAAWGRGPTFAEYKRHELASKGAD